jgi:prophage tail gpP-like protein
MNPVEITIDGSRLGTWTEMTLQRSKDEMTGMLDLSIFAGDTPHIPTLTTARTGAEILVYVGGQLAFTGTIDKRTGTGADKGKYGTSGTDTEHGPQMTATMGPNEYTIKLTARGKTKRLIDSSHQHETTNMLKPTTQKVIETLIKPWKTQLEWLGEVIKLDKIRFRDGSRVVDELHRIGTEYGYFMYETRDGKLRVTDGVGTGGGDDLILGKNILTFSAEQGEDEAKSEIKVKGQRSEKTKWGEESLLKTFKQFMNKSVKDFVPLIVQHYGDADEKSLERRGRFEANKRNAGSKRVNVEVWHVQTPSGKPWDIGTTHYVEIPPEGIFDTFECIELTYFVNADKNLKTTLILAPTPSGGSGGKGGGHGLADLDLTKGNARRSQAGVQIRPGHYPDAWSPPQLVEMALQTLVEAAAKTAQAISEAAKKEEEKPRTPPLELPPWFGDHYE